MASPYHTLGLKPGATAGEIRSAFRRLARKHHPDKGGDTAHMAEINAAYELIRDGRIPEPEPLPAWAPPTQRPGWRYQTEPAPVYVQTPRGSWRRARPVAGDILHGEPRPGEDLGTDQWIRSRTNGAGAPRSGGANGTGM